MSDKLTVEIDPAMAVTFAYRNWKGEVSVRRVVPMQMYFGSTPFHKEGQWLLPAYDLDKKEWRTFALKDIREWKPYRPSQGPTDVVG